MLATDRSWSLGRRRFKEWIGKGGSLGSGYTYLRLLQDWSEVSQNDKQGEYMLRHDSVTMLLDLVYRSIASRSQSFRDSLCTLMSPHKMPERECSAQSKDVLEH